MLPVLPVLLALANAPAPSIPWTDQLQPALQRAAAAHRLVMVDFYTDW